MSMTENHMYNYLRADDDATITPVINGGILRPMKSKVFFFSICCFFFFCLCLQ